MTRLCLKTICPVITISLFLNFSVGHVKSNEWHMLAGESPVTILAAGDIAECRDQHSKYPRVNARLTAQQLLRSPGQILALGDLAYPHGSFRDFQECYDPTWGQVKERTHPVPGNHDYDTREAAPYFAYWKNQAGEAGRGYYSFDVGDWHIIALNSNIEKKKHHKETNSAQHQWLKQDLAATQARCILAFWHHPVFSSGRHGNDSRMFYILRTIYDFGVSIVLTAHDHHYERFAPQDPNGNLDFSHGFRQFVVGTGGGTLRPLQHSQKNSEAFRSDTFGILKLNLYPDRYSWQFMPTEEEQPYDVGTTSCLHSKDVNETH